MYNNKCVKTGRLHKVVIELKVLYKSLEMTVADGLDRCKEKTWNEKIFQGEENFRGRKIKVWGM